MSIGYGYGNNFKFVDKEDYYRLNYITRNQKRPLSLDLTITEGIVEDFFVSWYPKDDLNLDYLYNPDLNRDIIFPMP